MIIGGLNGNGGGVTPPAEGFFLDGSIGEILIYSKALSTSQRQQIEGYLAQKWGLTAYFPPSAPYAKIPPPMTLLVSEAGGNPITYTPQVFLTGYQYTSGNSTWPDQSPYLRNASLENGTSQSNGAAHAVYFNGSTNWVFPDVGVSATWTCIVWCSISYIPGDACIITQIYSGTPIALIFGQAAQQGFSFYGPGWGVGTNIDIVGISSSTMVCFTGVWDGSYITTYVNGSSVGSTYPGNWPYDSGNQYRIGRRWDLTGYEDYVTGYVGEVRIYSQPFTAAQVLADYNYVSGVRPY